MKHDMLFMWQYYLCMYVVVVIIKAESEISLINCLHPMMCDEIMIYIPLSIICIDCKSLIKYAI